jgi:hypothetical protein
MSTWGTWGLMGVNVLLFLVFQIGVEPWRRKRLVKGFEDKVMEALEREGPIGAGKPPTIQISEFPPDPAHKTNHSPPLTITNLSSSQETPLQTPKTTTTTTESPHSEPDPIPHPSEPLRTLPSRTLTSLPTAWQAALGDLFSARPMLVRRLDLTTIALEGAAAGMALAGLVTIIFLRAR